MPSVAPLLQLPSAPSASISSHSSVAPPLPPWLLTGIFYSPDDTCPALWAYVHHLTTMWQSSHLEQLQLHAVSMAQLCTALDTICGLMQLPLLRFPDIRDVILSTELWTTKMRGGQTFYLAAFTPRSLIL